MTWDDARSYCQKDGADLARAPTRKNISEVNLLISELGKDMQFWIGLHDAFDEGQFRWIDVTLPSISNWATAEPKGHECAVVSEMSKYRKWSNAACNETKAFVCEKRDKSK